ncbi:hypothetical protein AUEXF2481DRAFT_181654 [Aureobasidium subglaciale EXF-2481]|uniref:Uncharacterized protein n=1 Tax=Aureobasidium subglaciale (strain EXF-2481) TaxID=1043005 RepID=A0A074ZMB8_AURSE|nr:uncharacterized protein AUEXF2481DRAFT_181654 [Aureobasidium subglaciale EXF-2481]KEQ99521.1 hypothetical protein AUEXF2481DRAFT_181654 [Aureobasidium subglaciale EXF-2481]
MVVLARPPASLLPLSKLCHWLLNHLSFFFYRTSSCLPLSELPALPALSSPTLRLPASRSLLAEWLLVTPALPGPVVLLPVTLSPAARRLPRTSTSRDRRPRSSRP